VCGEAEEEVPSCRGLQIDLDGRLVANQDVGTWLVWLLDAVDADYTGPVVG
jgi:hypothetical protein